MSPFDLQETIESARYRFLKAADAQAFGAYMMVRAWMGRKAPKFEKMLGRMTAAKFKEACTGRHKLDQAQTKAQITALRKKVEAQHGKPNR